MVSRMDKYSFLLYHAEVNSFLEELQDLGLVDIERESRAIDQESERLFSYYNRFRLVERKVNPLFDTLTREYGELVKESPKFDGDYRELLESFEAALSEREELLDTISKLKTEYEESVVWGDLDDQDIERIEALGYRLNYYSVSKKGYNSEWEENWPIQILNETEARVYFVLLTPKGEESNFDLIPAKSPNRSYKLVKLQLEEREERLKELSIELLHLCHSKELLAVGAKEEWTNLDLYLAGASTEKEVDEQLAILKGFAPTDDRESVQARLDEKGIYYLMEEAEEEDNPPIVLKNSRFSRLFEPIGELYLLPQYGELDLTPFFAIFYMLFFGMCLGDMGYGLTLVVAGGLAKFKFPKFKPYLSLVQLLGLGAVLMASLSGSFFGATITEVLPLPESVGELFLNNTQLFWFAILFGIVQIIFGKLVNAIYSMIHKGWQYGMANIGWTIVIVWAVWFYATTMGSITIPEWMHYVAIFGASLILLFSSDHKNIFVRLFKGGTAFYDITGFFGDMLSYIRLFGLGAAGAILGMVVNSVAFAIGGVPYIGWLFTLIMLLVGHTLVLLLSAIGAFVHPLRLTFVEFYKNAGFEGGGRAFRPLTKSKE